jgi:hypothetical protein
VIDAKCFIFIEPLFQSVFNNDKKVKIITDIDDESYIYSLKDLLSELFKLFKLSLESRNEIESKINNGIAAMVDISNGAVYRLDDSTIPIKKEVIRDPMDGRRLSEWEKRSKDLESTFKDKFFTP